MEQPLPTLAILRERQQQSLAANCLTREERRVGELLPYPDVERPQTRSDCVDGPRPCPFISCRHHLYIDVNRENGTLKFNFPDLEPWELKESCSLDVADRSGVILETVADALNITRERVRQVEERTLLKIRRSGVQAKDFT